MRRPNHMLGLLVLAWAAMAQADELSSTVKPFVWQQAETEVKCHAMLDRERYTNLDRAARLVCAAEVERAGHALADLTVRWTLRGEQGVIGGGETRIEQGGVDIGFPLATLAPGVFEVAVQFNKGDVVLGQRVLPLVLQQVLMPVQEGRVGLLLPRGVAASSWPVHAGVPMPKGVLRDASQVRVVDASGQEVDADVLVRGRWGHDANDSIRWLGVQFQPQSAPASWPAGGPAYHLEFGPDISRQAPRRGLQAASDEQGISIDTGAATFRIVRQGFNVIDQWSVAGGPTLQSTRRHGLYLVDHKGVVYRAANDKEVELSIEEQSAMHVVVRAAGWYVRDGAADPPTQNLTLPTDKLCRFVTRIEAYAGKPYVRVMNTLIITFDTFNVRLRDAGMSLPLPEPAIGATFGVEEGLPFSASLPTSGLRGVQHLHDAYSIEDGESRSMHEAKRSAGWVIARGGSAALSMSLRDTWQRYPKEFEVLPDALKLHVWPAHGKEHPQIVGHARDQMHRLMYAHEGRELNLACPWDYVLAACNYYGNENMGVYHAVGHVMAAVHAGGLGVATTSDVMLDLGPAVDEAKLADNAAVFQQAPHAVADPQWSCDSLALGYIHPYDPQTFSSPEQIIHDAMRGYWRYQDMGQMFGMWIYRSWLHSQYRGNGAWELYRLYNGTHHHEAIIPWLLYARSGDPFYLTQGMANIRQLTDVQMMHHADERYTHKEYHAHQRPVVGSTKHDDCLAPWGNDHAVMGHVVCYNAAITGYYLTGDLRLREVVVGEWLPSLLGDRLNRDVKQADLSGTAFPQNPRDNSVSISESLDAYQLTYDPRLLAYMAPRYDIWVNSPGCMGTDWGQPVHHEQLFRGSRQVREQLIAGVQAWRDQKFIKDQAIARPVHAPQEMFSVAAILEPQQTWAFDAFSMFEYGYVKGWAWNRLTGKVNDVFCNTGEFVLFLPRMMYAVKHSQRPDAVAVIGAAQPAPRHPGNPMRIVVREDADQEFNIYVHGRVKQENGFDVQVLDPSGAPVARGHVPPGVQAYELPVPSDGKTGEYVVFLGAVQKDMVYAPFTNLPEVYVASYWTGSNDPQRYFTRSPDESPMALKVEPHQGPGTVLSADQQTELANTETGEPLEVQVGPDGAWVWNRTCYIVTQRSGAAPAILSINPQRWFMPSAVSLAAKAAE